ncbi:amidohydrolase family protein [Hyphococcus formosus]|uniref:amidohydrolase family protein n=1 Tax=Hyphococcus formosus TaxID=3143534 RepID=UPI00398AA29F
MKYQSNRIFDDALKASIISVCSLIAVVACSNKNDMFVAGEATTVFENVRIVHFYDDIPNIQTGMSIVVDGSKIVSVGARDKVIAEKAANIIDAGGMTVIPGLTDMHVHIWDEAELASYLSYGITTVRNASGMPFHLILKEQIDAGEKVGPRLLTTGPILNSDGPNVQLNHQIVETSEDAIKAVRGQYETGYRDLKVYSNLKREPYDAIRSEASALGMTIMGHTPEGVRTEGMPAEKPFDIPFEDILDDGFTTIEHVESIVWHALRDRHDEEAARALAIKIADAGVAVTPTLVAHYNLYRAAKEKDNFINRAGTELLNPFIRETEYEVVEFWRSQSPKSVGDNALFYQRMTDILNEEDVLLVAGSDAGIFLNIPGESLIDELNLLVDAGLTPFEALQTATFNVAKVLREEDRRGRIATGYKADLALYDCDPLADIDCLKEPSGVMRNGIWYDEGDLIALREAGKNPSYDRTHRNAMAGLAAQSLQ